MNIFTDVNLTNIDINLLKFLSYKLNLNSMNDFLIIFTLWTETAGISQEQYYSLIQILQLLTDTTLLHYLLKRLSILKQRCKAQILILSLYHTRISIIFTLQLSTLISALKHLTETITKLIFYQNSVTLISLLIKLTNFCQKMHIKITDIINQSTEL